MSASMHNLVIYRGKFIALIDPLNVRRYCLHPVMFTRIDSLFSLTVCQGWISYDMKHVQIRYKVKNTIVSTIFESIT